MTDKTEEEQETFLQRRPYEGEAQAHARKANEEDAPLIENYARADMREPEPEPEEEAEPELSQEEATYKKRYGDLRRHMEEQKREWENERKSLEAKVEATPSVALPKTQEEIDEWRQNAPEAYDMVMTLARQVAQESQEEIKKLKDELARARYDVDQQSANARLMKMHPDWPEIKESAEFYDWLDLKPKRVQDLLYEQSTDADAAAEVISMYKHESGLAQKTAKKRRDELNEQAAALSVKGKRTASERPKPEKRIYTTTEIARMKPWEYEEMETDIRAAQQEGRIVKG